MQQREIMLEWLPSWILPCCDLCPPWSSVNIFPSLRRSYYNFYEENSILSQTFPIYKAMYALLTGLSFVDQTIVRYIGASLIHRHIVIFWQPIRNTVIIFFTHTFLS